MVIFFLFFISQWAEILGIRLEEMVATEKQNFDQINYSLNDLEKQKELLMQDEEEDFLDEGRRSSIFRQCFK